MRILITGGAGLIGSHAAEYWAGRGHQVTVFDNLMRSALFGAAGESVEHNWRLLAERPGVRLIRGDVRHADELAGAIGEGMDVVLHAAAQPGVGFSVKHPQEDFSLNALGTLQVLEAVRQRCPRATVLFCSTNKVYGNNVNDLPIDEAARRYVFRDGVAGVDESMPVDRTGHTPYGVSKCAADLYVQHYAVSYGMRTAVFRMSCTYGERQFGFEDQGWMAHFAISTILGRPITIYGDGKQVRDVLYVDDLIRAFDEFVHSPLPRGVFNIGGGASRTLSLLELLDLLEQVTGKRSPVLFRPWRPQDQKVYISDVSHIQRALGWQPRISVEEGVGRLVQWVERHRELFVAAAATSAEVEEGVGADVPAGQTTG